MTIDQVRTFCDAKSFQPFVLHLADGRQIPVHHPNFMAMAPSGRTVMIYQPDDSFNIVDLVVVTDLEARPEKNGSGKRRKP